jgi:hypothetical protein
LLTASLLKALKGGLEMDKNWCDWASLDKPGGVDLIILTWFNKPGQPS